MEAETRSTEIATMGIVAGSRTGGVKWYVPSIAALVAGVVVVIVVWVIFPPASGVKVPTFDPHDDRTEILLRLEDDATSYVVSGMEDMSANFKLVDGKMVYEPVEVRGKVVSIFRDVGYEAKFLGVWQLRDNGSGGVVQTITGTVTGTATIPWDASKKPSADSNVVTNCKIIDEHPKGRFLVEGKLSLIGRPILIGPGATIANARTDKKPMTFVDTFGNRHTLLPDEKVTVDSAGQWMEEDVSPTP